MAPWEDAWGNHMTGAMSDVKILDMTTVPEYFSFYFPGNPPPRVHSATGVIGESEIIANKPLSWVRSSSSSSAEA